MKRQKLLFILLMFLIGVQNHTVNGQFTPASILQRGELEEFLKTSEIVRSEDIGEGVTKPVRLYLKKGEVEHSGCWKNVEGMQGGFLEGWQYEIAAYELDKLLGLNLIPPTVDRTFKGKRGSLQFWVETRLSDLERMEQGIKIPSQVVDEWSKQKYLMRAFDCLIANEDRTQQNILYTEDWHIILIDHSRAFRSSKKFCDRLIHGRNGLLGAKLFRQLPRTFVEKIKALDFDTVKKAVGPYLEDKEIKAIVMRKKLLLEEIDEMIKERGEDEVLY